MWPLEKAIRSFGQGLTVTVVQIDCKLIQPVANEGQNDEATIIRVKLLIHDRKRNRI